jgi:hypothetical protein
VVDLRDMTLWLVGPWTKCERPGLSNMHGIRLVCWQRVPTVHFHNAYYEFIGGSYLRLGRLLSSSRVILKLYLSLSDVSLNQAMTINAGQHTQQPSCILRRCGFNDEMRTDSK